jgi:hypothetical protein
MQSTAAFYPADVQRPDNHRFTFRMPNHISIGSELFLLGRPVIAAHIQKLRSQQPDAFRAVLYAISISFSEPMFAAIVIGLPSKVTAGRSFSAIASFRARSMLRSFSRIRPAPVRTETAVPHRRNHPKSAGPRLSRRRKARRWRRQTGNIQPARHDGDMGRFPAELRGKASTYPVSMVAVSLGISLLRLR